MPFRLRSISILGCRVDDVTMEEAVALCDSAVRQRRPTHVVTPNAEIVVAAQRDPDLRRLINAAALSVPDGAGLLLAGRILGTPLREQVTGTDLAYRLAELGAARGHRLFLLGAAPGVAELAATRLRARYPGLAIAGTFAGDSSEGGDAETRAAVAAAGPVDVLLVAYGAPRQEQWIARHQAALAVPLAIGIGGAFDYMAGRARRAPAWLRRLGLYWLFRLITQPWRWRRQLALPRFVWLVARSARRARRAGRSRPNDQPQRRRDQT
jgi:N-acetylglucosaminyldiphosphoundecaprenol N-acetyl-beta-D-mannosaminyltransferase